MNRLTEALPSVSAASRRGRVAHGRRVQAGRGEVSIGERADSLHGAVGTAMLVGWRSRAMAATSGLRFRTSQTSPENDKT